MFTLSPLEIEALTLSAQVAFWAVLVSLPLGIAVAWLLARTRFPGKALVDALVHVPLVVPPVVIGYMLLVLLGRRGVIGSWLSLEAIDPRLEAAARTLGARPIGVFLSVTLPLTSSGILAGVILAFARSLGEFGATITFVSSIPGETRTLPVALYGLAQVPGGEAAALRIVVISVVIAVVALLASEAAARRLRARIRG